MNLFRGAPPDQAGDIVTWAEENVRLVGSVRSETYDHNITPWTAEPLRRAADSETNIITLIKPVQTGGTRIGLIALCWWLKFGYGSAQYNWEKQEKATDKWQDETLPTLRGCKCLDWSNERFQAVNCYAKFTRTFIRAQGVFNPDNLDSDSIPFQVNEEVHSWKPGHLAKARGRQTAVWRPKALDISNASFKSDQLDESWQSGTMQRWEVKCPGCGQFHVMRMRWDDKRRELGGLRYDSEGCKTEDGRFNYNQLASTIRYQMPCDYIVHDNVIERRALSLSGRYSEPTNASARLSHRSYTYEAVAVDFISWLQLIQEKQLALRALKAGDAEPWRQYLTERECSFYSDESRPFIGSVVLNIALKKNRSGLERKSIRLWAADKQRGYRAQGELSHYWLVIRDVMANCDSCLVFEGQIQTDSELLAVLDDHQCARYAGGVDVSWDTRAVTEFCYRNGLNAFAANASHKISFLHSADKVRRFYSEGKMLHVELNMPPRFNYSPTTQGWTPAREEPMVIQYNVAGLLNNLFFLREHEANRKANNVDEFIKWEVPGDVSEEYQQHNEAWERTVVKQARTKDQIEGFAKIREADHLLMCEAYCAMMMDIGGYISRRMQQLQQSEAA